MQKYFLMHKDDVCGDIVFDDDGRIITYKDKNTGLSPFLGNADEAARTAKNPGDIYRWAG